MDFSEGLQMLNVFHVVKIVNNVLDLKEPNVKNVMMDSGLQKKLLAQTTAAQNYLQRNSLICAAFVVVTVMNVQVIRHAYPVTAMTILMQNPILVFHVMMNVRLALGLKIMNAYLVDWNFFFNKIIVLTNVRIRSA